MNAEAAEALFEAERKGVRQIEGQMDDGYGGRCAMGVLRDAGWRILESLDIPMKSCPACGEESMLLTIEEDFVVHLNDDHHLTFSEIARKLGPDSV